MGVRGTSFFALLGVLLAVVALKASDPATPAAADSGHDYVGHTSDGSSMTADAYGPNQLQIAIGSASASCTPDGGVPPGGLTIPVAFTDGQGRRTGILPTTVSFQGRQIPREIQYEVDVGWSGDHLAGTLTRVDRFAGRVCVRDTSFRARAG